ncbi:SpoIIE family protein phosphatase [Kitasatospora atroaurantiaca]|uniref:PAS domain S-box-containing protein n=1 Tax=Kitasatospora atroaurantiaca TaxID=285545 RepID=A0A561F185_9ACTN|nr:SpoIIE family protein phosphatase [Kitasatospora atroaurantiaca]TWE21619.1 PAS domain S-box-containing protein [Kitasatospora atroaurantiaca]
MDAVEPKLVPEVFDTAVVSVALLRGPEHRLVYYNDAFRRLFGPRTIDAPAAEAFADEQAAPFITLLDQVYEDGLARQVTSPRASAGTAPGAPGPRYFVYSCTSVASRHGRGVLVVAVDTTTEVVAAERAEELSQQRQQALERYEALVSAVSQMVWLLRPDGSMTELVEGWEDFTGSPWRPVMDQGWLELIHPRDTARLVQAWADAVAGPPAMFEATFRVLTASGEYRHVRSRAVPVLREGRVAEWIGATADMEDEWRARLRERLLARVSAAPGQHLRGVFAAMAEAVVPDLTDACAVFRLPDGDGQAAEDVIATRVASAARPGLPALPALHSQSYRVGPVAREVIDSRLPRLLTFAAGHPPDGVLPDVSVRWLAAAEATSLVLVPIVVDSAVVAFAAAAGCGDSPPPSAADIALLTEVLQQAQKALRDALEHQHTRRMALILQRAQLTPAPSVPGADVAARYQPASTTAEIGGDWYDAFFLPDGTLALAIGDIAGHDLTAATAMGQLRSMLRALAYNSNRPATPADILAQLDRAAEGLDVAPFVTIVLVHLVLRADGWHAVWANAGHPPPLLIPADGPARYLAGRRADLPLCVDPDTGRSVHRRTFGAGDTLLLYTDGLVETPEAGLTEGLDRLAATATAARHLPVEELCDELRRVGDRRDDIALLAFRPRI